MQSPRTEQPPSGSQRSRHLITPQGQEGVQHHKPIIAATFPAPGMAVPQPPTQGPIFNSDRATTAAGSQSCPTPAELGPADPADIRGCYRLVCCDTGARAESRSRR
ncbi:hypothetical protein BDW71DRAFT_176354 [Aspergillus fruticulosus]